MGRLSALATRFFLLLTLPLVGVACSGQHSNFRGVAESFLDRPYGGWMLEVPGEPLTIRLDSVDCSTFVEYVVASLVSGEMPDIDNPDFCHAVERIRYRDGVRDGYLSRLHYATEWGANNVEKGILKDVSEEYSGTMGAKCLNFMSTHPDSYPALCADTSLLADIVEMERRVSESQYYYIPRSEVASIVSQLHDGDIVLFLTDSEGLDASHLGFVYFVDGRAMLLHASSRHGKVCVDPYNLAEYVKRNTHCRGIRVFRVVS